MEKMHAMMGERRGIDLSIVMHCSSAWLSSRAEKYKLGRASACSRKV